MQWDINFSLLLLLDFTHKILQFLNWQRSKKEGMSAYSKIQEQEFAREKDGYTSKTPKRSGYFLF